MTETQKAQQENALGSAIAASGATLMALVFSATSLAAVAWALVKLVGLPDVALWVLLALAAVPVLWATVWTAGRAWHVERRLTQGLDVDRPVFNLSHYFKKR
jgi:hypothetical protein